MVTDADFVESAADVAVTVAVPALPDAGRVINNGGWCLPGKGAGAI